MNEKPKMSDTISSFLSAMADAKADYDWCFNAKNTTDKLTQDYLHDLELGDLGYKDRAKIATKLAECRKRRREYKDVVEGLQPVMVFLDSEKGKQLMNLMNEVLGKTRKAEEKLQNRIYFHRVLDGIIRKDDGK